MSDHEPTIMSAVEIRSRLLKRIKEDGTLKVTSRKIRLKDNGISEFLEDLKRIEKESLLLGRKLFGEMPHRVHQQKIVGIGLQADSVADPGRHRYG